MEIIEIQERLAEIARKKAQWIDKLGKAREIEWQLTRLLHQKQITALMEDKKNEKMLAAIDKMSIEELLALRRQAMQVLQGRNQE